ncbi:CynX/NimT family MFS transporter [Acinetobacter sp. UBA1297]|uniref:MFS transporter n=1 Tax=Acinetobacter sp. UBA1297 TaxID=1945925 RepID=UPI00257FFE9B|nr:MFS transporter [Acinetobacter sp. UBA1297]
MKNVALASLKTNFCIIFAGYLAAIHVGKLSAGLPILQQEIGLSLTQAGLALSLVQAAGMCFALSLGGLSQYFGLKRCLTLGLVILGCASMGSLWINDLYSLFIFRFIEGIGFLFITLCAPALLKQLSTPESLNLKMGLWGSYMGLGVGLALLFIPFLLEFWSWQQIWNMLGLSCLLLAAVVYLQLPPINKIQNSSFPLFIKLLRTTLSHPPVLILALIFACYTSQWLTVIGFLPTLYLDEQISLKVAGTLTALVSVSNILGTFASGFLLHRGLAPARLISIGFILMVMMCWLAFSTYFNLSFGLKYLAIMVFSILGGFIPTTIFAISLHYAPQPNATATSIGLVLQVSAFAQLTVPPLTAALISYTQLWSMIAWVSTILSVLGLILTIQLFQRYPYKI